MTRTSRPRQKQSAIGINMKIAALCLTITLSFLSNLPGTTNASDCEIAIGTATT